MSATNELRRMLDERGAKYETLNSIVTMWTGGVCSWIAIEDKDGLAVAVNRDYLTPEQAIAATLGSCSCSNDCTDSERTGTCHDEGDPGDFCCSECGVRMFTDTSDTYTMIASDGCTIVKHPNYCPNCGRRIVGPTTNDADAEVDDG